MEEKMAKEQSIIEKTVGFDDIEADEARLEARRLQLYSKHALKVALPIDRIYVNHSRFAEGLDQFDRVFQLAPEVTMPHGLRLIGPTGSGKSTLFRYFRDSLPRSTLFSPGFGAVGIRVGDRPTAGQIVGALLRAYKYPFRSGSNGTVYARNYLVQDLIREKGTRLIYIDEADRLLNQRLRVAPDSEPSATLYLRDLMDDCRVGVVLGGTAALDRLDAVDSHLGDRISARHRLEYFAANKDWMGFLKAFKNQCQTFGLDLLEDPKEGARLHLATGGSPRRLKRLVTEGALIAANAGLTYLDVPSLAKGFLFVQGLDGAAPNPYV